MYVVAQFAHIAQTVFVPGKALRKLRDCTNLCNLRNLYVVAHIARIKQAGLVPEKSLRRLRD